jgi:hypothetical protein
MICCDVRSFFYFSAVVLLLAGTVAIVRPTALIVVHPGANRRASLENVTKRQALLYGVFAFGLGVGALYAATLWNKWQLKEDREERSHHRQAQE